MYGVIDCNNFYVSCERLFRPELSKTPVVVLSNNDGCIISRSNETKTLGFSMGAPIFQYKELIEKYGVQVFSANFPLYADISSRVMKIISRYTPEMEVYSIDEAFVDFLQKSDEDAVEYSKKLHNTIKKQVGIPVSIGIAGTKTLAKLGSSLVKHDSSLCGVCCINDDDLRLRILNSTPVRDIWGIGRKISIFLQAQGICTAGQLARCDDLWIKKHLSITTLHTVWELRGKSCIGLDTNPDPKKSIISSRSFGERVTTLEGLTEAVSNFAARAGEKLREEEETARAMSVIIMTSHQSAGRERYVGMSAQALPWPTDFTPHLIRHARRILQEIYKEGYFYKKAMVVLTGLSKKNTIQGGLFESPGEYSREERLMTAVDTTNQCVGKGILQFAAQGLSPTWKGKSASRSPRYTTSWEDLQIAR